MFKRADRIILYFFMIAMGAWFFGQWQSFLSTPLLTGQQSIVYDFKKGSNIRTLTHDLQAFGVMQHPILFELLARLNGDARRLKAGEYEIKPGVLPGELLHQIATAKVMLYKLTLVEGWTFHTSMKIIDESSVLQHTLNGKTNAEIMKTLGYADQHPEGLFLPETYRFPRNAKDTEVLQQAYDAMARVLQIAWKKRDPAVPYQSPYEALIAASLIEKETAKPEERPVVAGVIARRLKKGMLLQIDAAVLYGLNREQDRTLTKKDLEMETPYNLYLKKGLPPTPIALPSESSIEAALHPDQGDALYYVAKGDGSHVFSNTLSEHEVAVKQYRVFERAKAAEKPK